ncbi:MAG TPA: CHASE2 domain-containing protein [Chryseosolibacter sp.]
MKKIILKGMSVTTFVFLMMWGFSNLPDLKVFSFVDPISQALGEFELTDWVFSKFRNPPKPDDRIVLVNLGPSRRAIAHQVRVISEHKPKVIGIDSFFNCEGGFYDTTNCPQLLDTLGNLMLSDAIQSAGNVVLVSRLMQRDSLAQLDVKDVFDTVEYSDPMFRDFAINAFANLPTGDREGNYVATYQEDVKICRDIVPQLTVFGKKELAFSVRMAMMYDSVKTAKFLERGNFEEVINYKGNLNISDVRVKAYRDRMNSVSEFNALCYAIDWQQFIDGDYEPSIFQNSVVILGYLGDYFGDPAWEDKFFTPLNSKPAGRANPDMFGPVIHANVVAMILNEDYIDEIGLGLQVTIAVIICFLNVLLFYWLDKNFPLLYDALSVIIQLVQIVLVSGTIIYVFAQFNLKLDLTITMGAVALIGPCFDIYKGVENLVVKRLTPVQEPVLTTQD